MTDIDYTPRVQRIFHPSDFSEASSVAFAHALKFALIAKAQLSILHVADDKDVALGDFPGVRAMLERWGVLPAGSSRDAVGEIGIGVDKVLGHHADPVKSALHYLERKPTDLVVLATAQREGTMRWLHKSVAEPVARESGEMSLFVPQGQPGFVSEEDGSLSLRSILIPIGDQPGSHTAIEAACRAAHNLGLDEVAFTLVHVGEAGSMPKMKPPERKGWTWRHVTRDGSVVDAILETSHDCSADLIVMTTHGRDSFLDALRGSTTERVMRGADCPLLAIPA